MSKGLAIAIGIVSMLACPAPDANAAGTPAQKCVGAKLKAAGKKLTAKMSCNAKAKIAGVAVDPTCLSKAEAKFSAAITKAGNACAGDAPAIEGPVDDCVHDLLRDTPGNGKCAADSAKAAGKAGSGLLGCRAKEITKPGSFSLCDAKIDGKLGTAIAKAGNCADGTNLHSTAHGCLDTIDAVVEPPPTTTSTSSSSTTSTSTSSTTSTSSSSSTSSSTSTWTSSSTTTSVPPICLGSGVSVGSACWFFGGTNQSCTTVCADHDLAYDTATTSYAGSGGTDAHCQSVLDALGSVPGNLAFVSATCSIADECALAISATDTQRLRCLNTPANPNVGSVYHRRACACQSAGTTTTTLPCSAPNIANCCKIVSGGATICASAVGNFVLQDAATVACMTIGGTLTSGSCDLDASCKTQLVGCCVFDREVPSPNTCSQLQVTSNFPGPVTPSVQNQCEANGGTFSPTLCATANRCVDEATCQGAPCVYFSDCPSDICFQSGAFSSCY